MQPRAVSLVPAITNACGFHASQGYVNSCQSCLSERNANQLDQSLSIMFADDVLVQESLKQLRGKSSQLCNSLLNLYQTMNDFDANNQMYTIAKEILKYGVLLGANISQSTRRVGNSLEMRLDDESNVAGKHNIDSHRSLKFKALARVIASSNDYIKNPNFENGNKLVSNHSNLGDVLGDASVIKRLLFGFAGVLEMLIGLTALAAASYFTFGLMYPAAFALCGEIFAGCSGPGYILGTIAAIDVFMFATGAATILLSLPVLITGNGGWICSGASKPNDINPSENSKQEIKHTHKTSELIKKLSHFKFNSENKNEEKGVKYQVGLRHT